MSLYDRFRNATNLGQFKEAIREVCERIEALERLTDAEQALPYVAPAPIEYNGGPLVIGDGERIVDPAKPRRGRPTKAAA